ATVWKALTDLRNGGMPHYPGRSRRDFEENVELIRHVRNRASHRGACPTPRVDHIVQRVVSDEQPSPRRRIGRCTARARKIVTGVPSLGLRFPFFVLPYWYGHRVH
ncbi:hypothetical protein NNA72_12010, partial [Cutibacterium acnes]|nr:hypothetical protein [Cutibacterium acnes]